MALYPYRLYTPSCSSQKQFRLFTNLPQRRTSVRVVESEIGVGKLHSVLLDNRNVGLFACHVASVVTIIY